MPRSTWKLQDCRIEYQFHQAISSFHRESNFRYSVAIRWIVQDSTLRRRDASRKTQRSCLRAIRYRKRTPTQHWSGARTQLKTAFEACHVVSDRSSQSLATVIHLTKSGTITAIDRYASTQDSSLRNPFRKT